MTPVTAGRQNNPPVASGSARAATAGDAGRDRDGGNMAVRRKKYCPRCASRVSRSARRCGYCGGRVTSLARLAAAALIIIALLLSLGLMLGFL